ncbi:hypothetical protein ONR57_01465 [Hoyosella sp. YIM 151337]|uniref:hypothetical protein n=1 Tax=Hoyosella sp. YIM 151337 TaxID=2992742 RepID=UPI0022358F8D|nr:hypothetical protein [Hoyosella sp. YIM 151337]MCW4351968.1 hypothetical protein [Hoyosella sp. YIM 151337]
MTAPQQSTPESVPVHNHGHRWLMIACCAPIVLIVGVLVWTGTLDSGFLAIAAVCAIMMFAMMGMHRRGGSTHASGHDRQ